MMSHRLFHKMLQRVVLFYVLIVLGVSGNQLVAANAELIVSLTDVNVTEPLEYQSLEPRIGTIQSRHVFIDIDRVAGRYNPQGVDVLILDLFPGTSFIAIKDRVEYRYSDEGNYTWFGAIEGIIHSSVILTVEDGHMAGNIVVYDRLFQVRPLDDNVHLISEIDQSAFPEEAPPLQIEFTEPVHEAPLMEVYDDGSIIDVLVIYTDDVADASEGVAAEIQLAIDETNESYRNSNVMQRLRLVHTQEVEYAEVGSMAVDLECITSQTDDCLDEVHALRDEFGADLVNLWVENGEYCGIAWMMRQVFDRFEEKAFSVVMRICATGYYSFGHELGHNMGAHHDRYVAPEAGAYRYSHGYVHLSPFSAWRSVMAYRNECTDSGVYCRRIPYWSNPEIEYLGSVTGITDHVDNALTLNNTALTVANFRASVMDDEEETEISDED